MNFYTLCGHIGKVVASHAEICRVDSQLSMHQFILCMRCSGSTAHEGVRFEKSIGSIVYDAIVLFVHHYGKITHFRQICFSVPNSKFIKNIYEI